MRLLLALVLLLAVPAAAGAQTGDPPGAATGAATGVTRTTATLTGSVDPNGSPATYRFEYGTTSDYGLQTAERAAGDGEDAGPVEAPVEGLTPGTTYHYRLVATNAAGTTRGADRTLRTADPPRPPGVTGTGARGVGAQSATLRSLVDLNDGATSYRFEYGTTTSYGSRTPQRSLGTGDGAREVTEAIGGLRPYRRYHFRIVATNEAGTTASRNRSFTTARLPTVVTLSPSPSRVPWGGALELYGRVSGTGVAGIPVAFERQDFPFAGPFSSIGTPAPVRADRFGRFRAYVPALFSATRFRAVTRTDVVAISPSVTANVWLRVGAAVRRLSRKRVRIRGTVSPAAPNGRAALQRRTRLGGWAFVRGGDLRALGASRSRYSFKVAKRRTAARYRVRVIARDGGAHVPGVSRTVRVGARPGR
jgi:hypothetical protein